jgi:hypothetical protein
VKRAIEKAMEQCRELELARENGDWKRLRRGWCLGPKEFREELLDRIEEKRGKQHLGRELKESDEQKAERLVMQMLRRQRWTFERLRRQPKGNKVKATMAKQLREGTTMTWLWIARRLEMGHWRTAANAVRAIANG